MICDGDDDQLQASGFVHTHNMAGISRAAVPPWHPSAAASLHAQSVKSTRLRHAQRLAEGGAALRYTWQRSKTQATVHYI